MKVKSLQRNIKRKYRDISAAEKEAIHWYEKTADPDLTVEEGEEFRVWLAASDENRAAYDRYIMVGEALDSAGAGTHQVNAPVERKTMFPGRAIAAMAATLMLCVGVGLWALSSAPSESTQYATAVGERRTIALEDGSTVTLNTNSRIVTTFSRGLRKVDLVKGEGSFEIMSDPERPFQVHTSDGIIMAVGTVFDVRLREASTTFTLLEGRALVGDERAMKQWRRRGDAAPLSEAVMLEPGQRVDAQGAGGLSEVEAADPGRSLWKKGLVALNGASLADALAEMNRFSKTRLTLGDAPELQALKLSGTYKVGDPQAFSRKLEYVLPVTAVPLEGRNEILIQLREDG